MTEPVFSLDSPSLAVVIPTDGRYQTLEATVRNTLRLDSVTQLIIVNSSDEVPPHSLLSLLASDRRINYIKTDEKTDPAANFQRAISELEAFYCCFIGDDDILTSAVDTIVRRSDLTEFDAINCEFPISYQWPGYRSTGQGRALEASLVVRPFSGQTKRFDDPQSELSLASMYSYRGPQHLPRAYLGIVKTELIKKITSIHGSLFGPVSLDSYSSTLLAFYAVRYCVIDFPIIVPGASPRSTTAINAANKHLGRFEESAHLRAFKNLRWIEGVPRYYAVQTVWSYSMALALSAVTQEIKIDYPRLYRSFSIASFEFLKILFITGRKYGQGVLMATANCSVSILRALRLSFKSLLSNLGINRLFAVRGYYVIPGLLDSTIALEKIESLLRDSSVAIQSAAKINPKTVDVSYKN